MTNKRLILSHIHTTKNKIDWSQKKGDKKETSGKAGLIIRARTYEYKTENASSILELGRPRRSAVNTNFCIRVPGSQNPVTVLVRRNADVATAGMVGDQQQMKSYQVLRIL